jgi:putative radical SAM enzyme (TIGR03279 family)
MPLLIQEILPRSLAAKQGIKAGDLLLSINGHHIRDFIDLQFYGSDARLECELETPDGLLKSVEISRNDSTALGIESETYKNICCNNHCVFCFIDQMPPSLRETLYVKDDDYLFSFVFGNYISLTNLSEEDFDRIIEQRLSPLYVSVHTTNPDLRRKMMGYKKDMDVLECLHLLSEQGIQIHCQLVLVPEWNDKAEFKRTLDDLIDPRLNISSIGVVPVGLTKFRDKLSKLRVFTTEEAKAIVDLCEDYRINKEIDYLFCSDELFIRAGLPIPDSDYYQDYPQIENGIGLISLMLENWDTNKRAFLKDVRKKKHPLRFVTGVSAAGYLEKITREITQKAECCPASVDTVINFYMGETVTVSGLLTFKDISEQVIPQGNEIIALPGNIFNHDGITLDGFSQLDIKEFWQRDILIIDPLFDDWEWI